jgi:hypothetical protein
MGRHTDMTTVDGQPLLLFAGLHDRPRGGAGDLAGWFDSEADGRAAFRALREQRSDDDGWAELVALRDGGRARLVAWFGRPRADAGPTQRRLGAVGAARLRHPANRGARGHLRLLLR